MFLSAAYPPTDAESSGVRSVEPTEPEENTESETRQAEPEGATNFGSVETVNFGVRSRRRFSELPCCPVCGCTVRPGELRAHLTLELDRLAKLTSAGGRRRISAQPSGSGEDSDASPVTPGCTGSEVYERVRKNRERRLRLCRTRNENVTCPVCNQRLTSGEAEVHVDACLRKSSGNDEDDENIDVEGDGAGESDHADDDRFGVSYEWCSQVRVRAAALQLRDGGDVPHGALRIRRASTDTNLVVDGDEDDLLYGPPQYSPSRIIPQDSIIMNEGNNENRVSYETGENAIQDTSIHEFPSVSDESINVTNCESKQNGCHSVIVEALKSRIKELEHELGAKKQRIELKCLICIGPYTEPVVSVQCWHVYCEACWLTSLSAKKTCPQCNTITTSQHLRRIYL